MGGRQKKKLYKWIWTKDSVFAEVYRENDFYQKQETILTTLKFLFKETKLFQWKGKIRKRIDSLGIYRIRYIKILILGKCVN